MPRSTVIDGDYIPPHLFPLVNALCATGIDLAAVIARGPLGQSLGHEVGENADGDHQKALDVIADDMFCAALTGEDVRHFASEERDSVTTLAEDGRFAVAMDPLDGSSNIDVNVSIGTIFSIYEAADGAEQSFLRPAREQIAGGYIVYGPQCALVISFGEGTQMYVLDPERGHFALVNASMRLPRGAREFAINASNERHWRAPVRRFIQDCRAGREGEMARDFNMRWVGSLVAEAHRILSRGGVFLYPGDDRDGYENGRLRMIYECAPIALLVEQAGGAATDGVTPVLDSRAETLHARIPLVFGSADLVEDVARYHRES